VHTCSNAFCEASPQDSGAVFAGPEEYKLCPTSRPHGGEGGSEFFGMRSVVERTCSEDGRKTRQAHPRTGIDWV